MAGRTQKKIFKKSESLMHFFLSYLKKADMYGKNIVLTYDGDNKYRTHIGGFTSVFVGGIILTYVGYLFYIMFSKSNTNISSSFLHTDVTKSVEILKPGQNGFDFAFEFKAGGVDYLADESYFTFTLRQVEQIWVNDTGSAQTDRTKTDIPFEIWNESFLHPDQDEIKRFGIDQYYCPVRDDYSVAGSYFASHFNYIEIKLNKWINGTSVVCKTTTEIEDVMKDSRFSLAIENTVVNMKDYQNGVHKIVEDGLYWELVPSMRKKSDIRIRRNEAVFEDKYVQLGFPEEKEFFQVVEHKDSFETESEDGDILSIYFRYDKVSDIYERQVYSFAELIGQAGGFYGALLALGALMISLFTERLFVASILRKIYQIDTWQENIRYNKKKTAKVFHRSENQKISEKNNPLTQRKRMPETESEIFHENATAEMKEYIKEENPERALTIKTNILNNCQKSMNERRVFKYGYWLILHYIFCWINWRNEKSMRKKRNFRDHMYYKVGQVKFVDELDCVTIIKSIRRLKMLTQILLNKRQKFLLKFQRNEVIDSSSTGSSDEGQINIIDLMKSKDQKHQDMINDKIQLNISNYKRKELKDTDIRIIKGGHNLVYF